MFNGIKKICLGKIVNYEKKQRKKVEEYTAERKNVTEKRKELYVVPLTYFNFVI